jgi:RimJ/RimL family protein N-acetyltransferase
MRIENLTPERMADYHACLDSVARERRWIALTEAPPLANLAEWTTRTHFQSGFPCLLAIEAEATIGWANLNPFERPGHAHLATLGMGVLAPHRGRGVGDALLARLISASRGLGLERLELTVYAENRAAIRLYRKHGLVVEGVKRRYKKLGGVYDDGVMMALLLDAAA